MTPYGRSIYNKAPYLKVGSANDQPYLVKINPSLAGKASLAYSTFLGGGGFCTGVAIDQTGSAGVAGEEWVDSVEFNPAHYALELPKLFPFTGNALIPLAPGGFDAILTQIAPDGGRLSYSTYLGGTKDDSSYGLAVDRFGDVARVGRPPHTIFR